MAYTVQFGILLIVLGFGSVVLNHFTDVQFTLLSWADDMQPGAGIIVGLIGVALIAVSLMARRRTASIGESQIFPAPNHPYGAPPQQPYAGGPQQQPYQGQPYQGQPYQGQQSNPYGPPQQQPSPPQHQQPYQGQPQQQYPPRDQG